MAKVFGNVLERIRPSKAPTVATASAELQSADRKTGEYIASLDAQLTVIGKQISEAIARRDRASFDALKLQQAALQRSKAEAVKIRGGTMRVSMDAKRAEIMVEAAHSQKLTNRALQGLVKEKLNVDEVSDVAADLEESRVLFDELGAALAGGVEGMGLPDSSAADAEFDAGVLDGLPAVPVDELGAVVAVAAPAPALDTPVPSRSGTKKSKSVISELVASLK